MAGQEQWQLVGEDVTLIMPVVSRDTTPDEFLETDERQHTMITFQNMLVGCKVFEDAKSRDEWVSKHPMGKRIELYNPDTQVRKAGNIVEIKIGDPPDDLLAAIMIYIERIMPPEHVQDWVI